MTRKYHFDLGLGFWLPKGAGGCMSICRMTIYADAQFSRSDVDVAVHKLLHGMGIGGAR